MMAVALRPFYEERRAYRAYKAHSLLTSIRALESVEDIHIYIRLGRVHIRCRRRTRMDGRR